VQFKTRNELIPAIMQLFADNPEAHVMVIVDPDAGPEVIQTHPSRIWSFGLLAAAEKMLDGEYQALKDAASWKKLEAQAEKKSSGAPKAR
jgi:hypothetical protein